MFFILLIPCLFPGLEVSLEFLGSCRPVLFLGGKDALSSEPGGDALSDCVLWLGIQIPACKKDDEQNHIKSKSGLSSTGHFDMVIL